MSRKLTEEELRALRESSFIVGEGTRGRLLAVAELMYRYTDEVDGLTSRELVRILSECTGECVAENSVRADLDALAFAHLFGAKIMKPHRGEKTGYRCVSKSLSSEEAALLISMVKTSKFIIDEQRDDLSRKLEGFMSDKKLDEVTETVYVDEREVYAASNVLDAMRAASVAIRNEEQLSFRYRSHWMTGEEKSQQLVSEDPVSLIYSFGYYYLETCVPTEEDPEGSPFFRRLDHMTNAFASGRKIVNSIQVGKLWKHIVSDVSERIDMYGDGRSRTLFLEVEGSRAQYVYDRFGHDLKFEHIRRLSSGEFLGYACVRVQLSPTFYRWLFGMGPDVILYRPEGIRWVQAFRSLSSCNKENLNNLYDDYEAASNGYVSALQTALRPVGHDAKD